MQRVGAQPESVAIEDDLKGGAMALGSQRHQPLVGLSAQDDARQQRPTWLAGLF